MAYEGDLSALPLGFGMALAQNTQALRSFSDLPTAEQQAIIEKARRAGSAVEMQALVDSLTR